MDYKGYKLVRDKIPEVIKFNRLSDSEPLQLCERVLDKSAYLMLLNRKLKEEVAELDEACGHGCQDAIENELADVHEVLVAISDAYRCRDVVDLASEKAHKLGGFYQGHILKIG
jgi:predicted house-cleaning noncanonical NTP pyrophosphatase (MazG superfamily)